MDCENSHWTYSKPLTEMVGVNANKFEYVLSKEEDRQVCEELMRLWNENPVFTDSRDWKSCESGIPDVETIRFRIQKLGNSMCRIESVDIRGIYRHMAGGGCICSLDVLLAEMGRIAEEVEKLGNTSEFIFTDMSCNKC